MLTTRQTCYRGKYISAVELIRLPRESSTPLAQCPRGRKIGLFFFNSFVKVSSSSEIEVEVLQFGMLHEVFVNAKAECLSRHPSDSNLQVRNSKTFFEESNFA